MFFITAVSIGSFGKCVESKILYRFTYSGENRKSRRHSFCRWRQPNKHLQLRQQLLWWSRESERWTCTFYGWIQLKWLSCFIPQFIWLSIKIICNTHWRHVFKRCPWTGSTAFALGWKENNKIRIFPGFNVGDNSQPERKLIKFCLNWMWNKSARYA